MTEEEALERLTKLRDDFAADPEMYHGEADKLMLEIFTTLGWRKFVAAIEHDAEDWWWA